MRTTRKIKGQSKRKRWQKGHSSSSNPETTKHRDLAHSKFFSIGGISKGKGTLTAETLKLLDDYDITDKDDVETVKTFATRFTNCSNISFNRMLQNMRMNSAHHKDIVAVLAAVTEVIKSKGGQESDTEYFAALMSTIGVSDSEETLSAVFTLLAVIIRKVPISVLRVKFGDASKVFVELLGTHYQSPNNLLRNVLKCLSHLLISQDLSVWNDKSTLHIFHSMLRFILHEKPKVRKSACESIFNILNSVTTTLGVTSVSSNPLISSVGEFCLHELTYSSEFTISVLHLLGFLKQSIQFLTTSHIKSIFEAILKLMHLKHHVIYSCSLQVFHSLFEANLPDTVLNHTFNEKLLTALHDFFPNVNESQQATAWLLVMKEGHLNLFRLNRKSCFVHFLHFINKINQCFLSGKDDVRFSALEVTKECFNFFFMSDDSPTDKLLTLGFSQAYLKMETCLKFQYSKAWNHIIQLIGLCYQISGVLKCGTEMKGSLMQLAEIRAIPQCQFIKVIDDAIGTAIRHLGPKLVTQAIPLLINGDESDDLNFPHSWILPLLRDNIQNTDLNFFTEYFLPLATKCKDFADSSHAKGDETRHRVYSVIYVQIWSLLPGFCRGSSDPSEALMHVIKTLGLTLKQSSEVRKDILTALRILLHEHPEDKTANILKKYSKNFLPLLFEIFTSASEEKHLQTTLLDTIKLYLGVADTEVFQILFKKVYDKMQHDTSSSSSLLVLMRSFIGHCSAEELLPVFNYCLNIVNVGDEKLEKLCLKILEEICQSKSESCKQLVLEKRESLKELIMVTRSGKLINKAPRLIILSHVVKTINKEEENFLQDILPEAVLCVKQSNKRARSAAFALIIDIADSKLKNNQQSPEQVIKEFFISLFAGLAGSTTLISATILAVSHVLFHYKDMMTEDILDSLVHDITLLMTSASREVVQSCLSFIHTFSSLPLGQNSKYLSAFVKSVDSMASDNVRHFRLKVRYLLDRLMRKNGYDAVLQHVSPHSTILLKMMKNIRKQRQRKSRKDDEELDQEVEKTNHTDGDSEFEDFEDLKGHSKAHKSTNLCIEENPDEIVDLLSSTSISHLRAGKTNVNKETTKTQPFRQGPDGRFIIADSEEDQDDESDEDTSNKKRKLSEGNSSKYQPGGTGIHRPLKKSKIHHPGSEYKSKKAAGDIKVKGKHDPYAYIPLDRKGLNKRKNIKLQTSFRKLVRKAQEGARKGVKGTKLNKRK